MGYARVLVARWARREWLTVLVVAVTTAFLVGTALLLLTAGSYTATLEDDLSGSATVEYYGSVEAASEAAPPGSVVVPVATAADGAGNERLVVGVPADAPRVIRGASVDWRTARLPSPPEAGLLGPAADAGVLRLDGSGATREFRVRPQGDGDSLFPAWWFVGSAETVADLGSTGAFVVTPGDDAGTTPSDADRGTPLIAALPFLLGGIRQVVRTLSVAGFAGGVLVLVVVYSVMRMAIRDRIRVVRVVRASGESPLGVFGVLVARAALLVAAGAGLGYAFGVIATNAVINAAVYAGLPVSIEAVVTPRIAGAVAAIVLFVLAVGTLAGALAALPAVRTPPARLRRFRGRSPRSAATDGGRVERVRDLLTPTVLDPRAAVPTTATLAVFVLVVLLVSSLWGAFAPLAATSDGTIVQEGAAHAINSRVDPQYAELLRANGVPASSEIIHAQVTDGRPYLIRGANFSAFAAVSGARLIDGRAPETPDEAVIGESLARTLGVRTGEELTLGGSVTPGIRRVAVVGVYEASGIEDDQLVVPLETVSGLSTGGDSVHLIRTDGISEARFNELTGGSGSGIAVTGLSAPSAVARGDAVPVRVDVRNFGDDRNSMSVRVLVDDRAHTREVSLGPDESTAVEFDVRLNRTGTHTVAVGGYSRAVRVSEPRSFRFPAEFPRRAPPGATLFVPATTPNESLVSGATVSLGGYDYSTDGQGVATVLVPNEPGQYEITVRKDGYEPGTRTLTVEEGTPYRIGARLSVTPNQGSPLTRPQTEVLVANPWGRTLDRNLTLVSSAGSVTRRVELRSGNVTATTVAASRLGFDDRTPPGTYEIHLVSEADGTRLASATYTVRGDRRVLAAAASGGSYARGTGIGRTIENVFGNVQLLFAVLIALAGVSTVGGTTATFTQAVHARRRTIGVYRATGATARQVLAVLVADALRLSIPSTLAAFAVAVGALWALRAAGLLVVFGIRLAVPSAPALLAGTFVGALSLSVISACLAASAFLRAPPWTLLRSE